jgi:hypothetical protein
MGAAAWLEDTDVEVAPGLESEVELRIRNTGAVLDEFSFAPIGMAQGWISVEPSVLSLFPGAEEGVRLHFRPPRLYTTLAGASPFAVKVVPREDPESTAVVEGTVHVAPFDERTVDLIPAVSRGRRAATHGLIVHNTGNAPLVMGLAGGDPGRQLAFDFNPVTLNIPPGTAQHSQVRVRPRPRFWTGDPRTWPFQLLLTEPEREPQLVDGAMLQEPLLPDWFGRAVAAAIAAVVVLIALWFLALKPLVQDTARDAVRDELAPVRTALTAAGITVPPTTVKGGTLPPPPVTTTTINPLGDPVQFRLSLSSPQYAVPAGQTLYVTDITLQNPDSNTGRLTVAVDNQPLFDSSLDFFRDLPNHYVSPIEVPAGSTLTTTVVCTGPPGGQCTAAATFGGFLKRA